MRTKRSAVLLLAWILTMFIPGDGLSDDLRGIKRNNAGETRRALVIGNGGYHVGPLKNPPNDAALMARTLRGLGFEVDERTDLDLAGMNEAIDRFGGNLKGATVALFYYAGHGAQFQGGNYLIPVGVDIKKENELPYRAVNAGLVLAKMESEGNPVNLVILDACRNNPFARSWRTQEKGLANMPAPRGTKIFYATRPNMEAHDGDGDNSPFTESLSRHMKRPGLELDKVFREVARDVEKETARAQTPWTEGMILSDFYFTVEEEEQGPGKLEISLTPEVPGAWVRINGTDYGSRREFTIQARGDYRIEIGAEGYETHRATETLGPGIKKTVKARLEKEAVVVAPEPEPAPVVPAPAASGTPRARDEWTEPVTGMTFVYVPKGCFQMGSNDGDDDEKPVHEACVDGFWMGKHEVTVGQWKKFVSAAQYRGDGENIWRCDGMGDPEFSQDSNHPVACVSWKEATAFAEWLSKKTGKKFRLPTEAEWEYAARSGGKAENYSGGNDIDRVAWYDGNSGGKTHPVGTKAANGLGIHDMSGNVWEWCRDWYGDYPSGSVTDPAGPSAGSSRVLRGGCWLSTAALCRSANRSYSSPGSRDVGLGFRLSRTP